MDAFAVSVTLGLSVEKPTKLQCLIPGIYFGFFQALMPFIGFLAGTLFAGMMEKYEHWVAFALLGLIGGNMIRESFSKEEKKVKDNAFNPVKMFVLAVATSIDALAAGITFAFFKMNLFVTILLIGLTTFIISIAGVKIGNIFGKKYKAKAEFAGGVILVLLGVKFLAEHLFFSKG